MTPFCRVLPPILVTLSLAATAQGQPAAICRDPQECRQLALDAAMRGEYEQFHDLAWRAVQTGPKNDPGLMYILARAQVLSGRPHDALVMLKRLADMGVATDAPTNADFARTRELAGWPEVADAIARAAARPEPSAGPVANPPATVIDRPKPSPPAITATAPAPPRARRSDAITPTPTDLTPPVVSLPVEPAPVEEAGRFTTATFRSAGLAYDAVSQRFVIGDVSGRKLIVVGIGSETANDMVRADSAGFGNIVALEIDEKRGDLWVLSDGDGDAASALHRLQLVSGRPLKTFRVAPALGPTRLISLAVEPSGAILALDGAGNRLLELAAGGSSDLAVILPLKLAGATSLAVGDNGVAYIAHDAGIARVDLRARRVAAVTAPKGLDLRGFETIRAHRSSLIGLRATAEGRKQLVRLDLDAAGRAARRGIVIDQRATEEQNERVSLSISADNLYYLAASSSSPESPLTRFVVRRLTLR